MNGALLLIPLFLIRYGLLSLVNRHALSKAAHFPPMHGIEKVMYLFYQASTLAVIVYLFFLRMSSEVSWWPIGLAVYIAGVLLLVFSTIDFAQYAHSGICQKGLYRFSRNPMYVAYFVYFLGSVLLTQSPILFVMVCVFQASSHWIILSEERWCINQFGAEYIGYMKKVRRYI